EYEYFKRYDRENVSEVDYSLHPKVSEFVNRMQMEEGAFFTTAFSGADLAEWRAYRKRTEQVPDPLLEDASSLHYYFYSIGSGGIGISTYNEPLDEQNIALLRRFSDVFTLAYRRYADIERAEAQAREARIETALERVRARTMAMQRSEELTATSYTLFEQFRDLGTSADQMSIAIVDEQERTIDLSATLRGTPLPQTYKVRFDGNEVLTKIYHTWKAKDKTAVLEISGVVLEDYNRMRGSLGGPMFASPVGEASGRWIINLAFFSHGALSLSTNAPVPAETVKVLSRFASVFDLTYRRFLDLQRAEAQAKEAQVQTALERVRALAMGMNGPGDLLNICEGLFKEFRTLGFSDLRNAMINIHDDSKSSFLNYDYSDQIGGTITPLTYNIHPVIERQIRQIRSADDAFSQTAFSGRELEEWKEFRKRSGERDDPRIESASGLYYYFYSIGNGSIGISTFRPITDEQSAILKRFRNVFKLSYQRFTDITRAEAQAREARIETSLERVRARSVAMHNSDELVEASDVLFSELGKLGIEPIRTGIGIYHAATETVEIWSRSELNARGENKVLGTVPQGVHPLFDGLINAWKSNQPYFSYDLTGDEVRRYYETLSSYLSYPPRREYNKQETISAFFFPEGSVNLISHSPLNEDQISLLTRFARVFGQMYRRFLDLQRAEKQAREAQIEASLERVRAVAMSMMKSDDLLNVCKSVFTQLQALGFARMRNAQIYISDDPKGRFQNYNYSDHVGEEIVEVQFDSHPNVKRFHDAIHQARDAFAHYEIAGADLEEWRSYLNKTLAQKPDDKLETAAGLHYYFYSIGTGALGICTFEPIGEEELKILKRFRNVFDLSYKRYSDIALAEAQSREAQIEVSLERVRSRTLAMQSSDELAETAAVLFRQLIMLGIAPNRLYIAIMKDEAGNAEFWITDEDGSKVSSGFAANLHDNPTFGKMLQGLEAGEKSITIDMQGEELHEYFRQLSILNVPFKGGMSQTRRVQSIAYFSKGFIGIASPEEQPEATTRLLERFAAVFNLTITRFHDLLLAEAQAQQARLDLVQLQSEKKRAEEALSELRATQEQLVQQEKLASLGQLTAGIAHEIKNPLNFVNNFSSVSVELLDEAIEEIRSVAGDLRKLEIEQMLGEVKSNLTKIVEHGTRADGIVKSMLHHSRGGSGKMEPTDLNGLVKEYVNLAFHGMRAGKNPINVRIVLDLDESTGKALLVAEDFSRVILNLCQNAFDAMREKINAHGGAHSAEPYAPALTVRSRRDSQRIVLEIEDNGPGIPEAIRDKILQPFFTTKKGTQGTGLGLSISHDIVKAHRGELTIAPNHPGGARFLIGLPGESSK
ncbi:MAG TPA: ATP-binding protein, partial [Bacteroidota bacterium]|nr:ATP-binding protein [Bacteroidota bacterium]